jgi:hypothetical protein
MAEKTVSFPKGKGSIAHNNREFLTSNIDADRTHLNITYVCEPLEVAYEKCFGSAIRDYNASQKRSDRKIDGVEGYMDKIRTSKNGEKLFYENIMQVGNMFDSGILSDASSEVCKEILDRYAKEFQERNPNLYVFNMVLHLDEKTPHLHIDYIPVANGYKNGMQVRNSLDKALKEQGVDGEAKRFDNSTIRWEEREKDRVGAIMKEYGIDRTPDKGLHRKGMTLEQYKATAEMVANEIEMLPDTVATKPHILDKSKVIVDKDELVRLEKRAKLVTVLEEAKKGYVKGNDMAVMLDYVITENHRLEEAERRLKAHIEQEANKLSAERLEALNSQIRVYESENIALKKTLSEMASMELTDGVRVGDLYNQLQEKKKSASKQVDR